MESRRGRMPAWAPALLVPALFLLATLLLVFRARGLPDNDYWSMIAPVLADPDAWPSLTALLDRSNEHIVAGPVFVFWINFHLTAGENFGLSAAAALFAFACAVLVALSWTEFAGTATERFVAILAGTVFVFTPMAAHNHFLGMSGVVWIGANLFLVLACFTFRQAAHRDGVAGYGLAALFALVASLFYSTGLLALIVLGIQGLWSPKTRRIGMLFLAAGMLYLAFHAMIQPVPERHGSRNFDLSELLAFCLSFVGGGLTAFRDTATVFGAIGFLAAIVVCVRALVRPGPQAPASAFWIALMAYAAMAGGLAAIGRSGIFGQEGALSSRYATLPALFWIGLFGAVAGELRAMPGLRRAWLVVFAACAVMALSNGIPRVEQAMVRAERKVLATFALSLGINDLEWVNYLTPVPKEYYAVEARLKEVGHVPFDGSGPDCPRIGETVPAPADPTRFVGHVDAVAETRSPPWIKLTGWVAARSQERPPLLDSAWLSTYRCFAFVDEAGTVVGLGLGGGSRPDVASALNRSRDGYGWTGFVNLRALPQGATTAKLQAVLPVQGGWLKWPEPVEVRR
ncbi:MAG: hypothetical protein VYD64_06140 [Pseudomonadota bacterium]|nr:hypothetical protein [Pseudomonadota bacterium]